MNEISRVRRSKDEARHAYDRMSRWYDFFASSEKKFTNEGLGLLDVRSGEKVLEIGFGTGDALLTLARAAQPETLYGIDLSPEMRIVAERKLKKANVDQYVQLQTGDAAALPYVDGFFDALFLSFTLELFDTPEISHVLAECHRVLRGGGRLGAVVLEKQDRFGVRIYEWFHRHMPRLVDCRPIYAEESLVQAGFTILIKKLMTMWGLPVSILVAKKTP